LVSDLESTAPFYLLGFLALAGFVYLLALRGRIETAKHGGMGGLTTL